jgi:OmpA-OmpF porin, OOP family
LKTPSGCGNQGKNDWVESGYFQALAGRNVKEGCKMKTLKDNRVKLGKFGIAALVASAGLCAQAQSGGSSMYSLSGGYIGVNAGQSNFMLDSGTGVFPSNNRDNAYGITGGGYFTSNFGLELGFIDFGRAQRAGGNTKAQGLNVSLIGKLPLGESFNLLGKVGAIYSNTDVQALGGSGIAVGTENNWGWSVGLGAEYAFSPKWSGVLQYDEHDVKFVGGGSNRLGFSSLGLRYRF